MEIKKGRYNGKRISSSKYQSKRSGKISGIFRHGNPVIAEFGGKVLARGPGADRHEGSVSGVVMMIEFESKAVGREIYFSDAYQAAKAVRDSCAETDLMIIEGAE